MNGIIMHRHASRLLEFQVDQNIGDHGTKIFKKLFVVPKHPTVTGRMVNIFTETQIYIAPQ
jgi:hypothetical protein